MQKCDCVWLAIVIAGAVAFSIWGLPYFTQLGHSWWAVLVYAFFFVLFLYGRANRVRDKKLRDKRPNKTSGEARVR